MLKKTMEKALNEQINAEFFSAYLYLSMASYFESLNLSGMSAWMRMQAREEVFHATKLFDYVNERGGRVLLSKIEGPKTAWKSPLDVFEDSYNHECKVTSLIHNLVDLSIKEKDHATNAFLQWYVDEQVEEESSVLTVVEKLKLAKDNSSALLMLDTEFGKRVFVEPAGKE